MENELKLNELITAKDGELVIVTEKVDQFIDYFEKMKKFEKEFRDRLLSLMIDHNIQNLKTDKYTCSQVKPKDTVVFDTDKFIENTPGEILIDYVNVTRIEKPFDLEGLKNKYPEIYDEFASYEDKVEVDLNKLKKYLPGVYKRYASEIKSDKAITLKVK